MCLDNQDMTCLKDGLKHECIHAKNVGDNFFDIFEKKLSRLIAGDTVNEHYMDGENNVYLTLRTIPQGEDNAGNVHVNKIITWHGQTMKNECFVATL